jgi:hypothetical protein
MIVLPKFTNQSHRHPAGCRVWFIHHEAHEGHEGFWGRGYDANPKTLILSFSSS